MKNKLLIYILIIAVIGVWGYVVYRIIKATQVDDMGTTIAKEREINQENLSYYTIKSLDSLSLEYRDPLYNKEKVNKPELEQVNSNNTDNSSTNTVNYDYVTPKAEIQIVYLGFIKNEKSNKKTALIEIQNKQYMASQNETIQGVKIVTIHEEYIRIKTEGKHKTIFK